jgi:hypothetical protein
MMAGFAAMGRGREGPVPLSPLGISEFTEGYLEEDASQRASVPAAIATLEYLKNNPQQKRLYLETLSAEAGVPLGQVDPDQAQDTEALIFTSLAKRQGLTDLPVEELVANYKIVDSDGRDVDAVGIARMSGEDAKDFLSDIKLVKRTE